MRIFIIAPDNTGSHRKTRLTLVDCASTTELLRRICALCCIQLKFVIAKIKLEPVNVNFPIPRSG